MKAHQRMYAGAALSRQAFCIAVVEPDPDDPYSFILSYDASFPQPWARVDARRIINSITALTAAAPPAIYAALSGEGDVYLLETQQPVTEKSQASGFLAWTRQVRGPPPGSRR